MDEFRTIAKLWPSGTELNLGTDSNLLGGSATFTRDAPNFVTDGAQNYQFLFWNTGRHTTHKRRVRWNFSVLGWGTWTATRWYGTPSGGAGVPRVHADAFSIGGDVVFGATPIDAAASTFAPGTHPFNGDDHAIGTAGAGATVIAKDPFSNYDFAGWLQLIWGGDATGEFVESDSGSGGTIGGSGFYDQVDEHSFAVAKGASADLLATYGHRRQDIVIDPGRIRDWFFESIFEGMGGKLEIPPKGDPSPMDRIRLKLLEQLLSQTQPGAGSGTDFQRLIEAAPNMSPAQLKQTVQSLKTTLDLGKTALSAIEAQLTAKNR